MTALERIVYAVARAWFTAYFELRLAARQAVRESANEQEQALRNRVLDRFRDLVRAQKGDPGP
jgi:hypothetical protein